MFLFRMGCGSSKDSDPVVNMGKTDTGSDLDIREEAGDIKTEGKELARSFFVFFTIASITQPALHSMAILLSRNFGTINNARLLQLEILRSG